MTDASLSAQESAELLRGISDATAASLPLAPGLRAAAREAPQRKVRSALLKLAAEVEAGQPLESSIGSIAHSLGSELPAVIEAGTRSGRLTEVLTAIEGNVRLKRHVRRQIANVLVYPSVLMAAVSALALFVLVAVIPGFSAIYREFGIRVSLATEATIWASNVAIAIWKPLVVFVALAIVVVIAALRFERVQALFHRVPMVGPALRWTGDAAGFELLGLLTEAGIPLPMALRQVSAATESVSLRRRARAAACAVENGDTWWMAFGEGDVANLASLASDDRGKGELSSACFAAAEMLEGRVRAMTRQVLTVAPATIFFVVLTLTAFILLALLAPMMQLLAQLAN